jgi:hypothetical protein
MEEKPPATHVDVIGVVKVPGEKDPITTVVVVEGDDEKAVRGSDGIAPRDDDDNAPRDDDGAEEEVMATGIVVGVAEEDVSAIAASASADDSGKVWWRRRRNLGQGA